MVMKRLASSMVLAAAMLLVAPTAQAVPIVYTADLSGAAESSPNASPGTGSAFISLDTIAHTLSISVTFANLVGATTVAHLHCCIVPPGNAIPATTVPTLAGFPAGVTSGSFATTLDLTLASSWNASFVTAHGGTIAGAEAALIAGLADGEAYFNIHTEAFAGGEIRGFLVAVPEPATLTLFGAALAGLVLTRRRARM
jgi:hypothetical protein